MSKGIGNTMADDSKNFTRSPAFLADCDVTELAKLALQQLASPKSVRPALSVGLSQHLDALCEAFLADSNEPRHQQLHRMRRDGISVSEIIDHVIPAVARVLGQRWTEDTLSFVEVTIGSARLQEAVRGLVAHELSSTIDTLHTRQITADPGRIHTPRVLLVIPRSEDHTLGVFVAADQFRRLGYDVDVAVDQHPKQIAVALRERHYSMVGITVAGRRTLASSRELVDIIRATVTRVTPIVLGGSLLETDEDLKMATGVDHVARSVQDALDKCGLNIVELDPPHLMMAGCNE